MMAVFMPLRRRLFFLPRPSTFLNSKAFSTLEHDQEASYGGFTTKTIKHITMQAIARTHMQALSVQESNGVKRWKELKYGEHGVDHSCIPTHTWVVLRNLREKGHEVYLVGGSVRDLLLKSPPKDFDVLTTAEQKQVKQLFKKALIVGRRFPVCHVHVYQKIVEVSSFSTNEDNGRWLRSPHHPTVNWQSQCESNTARLKNSMKRDFTINGLMFEPFESILYDYIGGLEDLRKKKVRTIIPADRSFQEDCARILRAIRIAARLGFSFARDTARALRDRAHSILELPQSRLMMEADYMLSYGGAEQSFRLLWRFGILEILFPFQAAYFTAQGFSRRDERSNMLLQLMGRLDRLISPDRPCHSSLWYCVLGLHLALVNKPQSHVIVSALALGIHKEDLDGAIKQAKRIHADFEKVAQHFPELLVSPNLELEGNELKHTILQLQNEAIEELGKMKDPTSLALAMQKYPEAPLPRVILSKVMFEKCRDVFRRLRSGKARKRTRRVDSTINYDKLTSGDIEEVSFALTHIFMNTLYSYEHNENAS